MNEIISFITSVFSMTTPLLIAALGVVFSAKAGIVNIGTEGFMLTGALFGVVGSYYSGSAFVGALCAMLSGTVISAAFAVAVLHGRAAQNVVGVAINLIATGMTVVFNRVIFGINATVTKVAGFDAAPIPLLSEIPILGQTLFNQPILCYMAFLLVPLAWFVMQRTATGLKVRAVGEDPKVCDMAGISVMKVRWATILLSGAMCGLGGAYMSMGNLRFFSENMLAGEGFMVLAAVVFGNYSPLGVMGACTLFGAANALRYRLTATLTWVPYQFWTMLPYVITILTLCGLVSKPRKGPASSGVPYVKE